MTKLRRPFLLLLLLGTTPAAFQSAAQEKAEPTLEVEAASGADYFVTNGVLTGIATNGVTLKYLTPDPSSNAVLKADRAMFSMQTKDIYAEGSVRLQRNDQTWVGERLHYNYGTRQMDGDNFRTGKSPVFAAGQSFQGQGVTAANTNAFYTATNAYITTDDYAQPWQKIRARHIKIVPGKYFEAEGATLYEGGIPVMYLPYYRRDLGPSQNNFTLLPGYRSVFGPYLLTSYNYFINEYLSGALHGDYRERRGFGGGPDVDAHLGKFGEADFKYYFAHDKQPGFDPTTGAPNPEDRKRIYFSYDAEPATNLTFKSQVAWLSDPFVTHDFFESQFQKDTQPNTYFDVNKFWRNWSLDAMAQPRVNPFYETVERLPEVRLTGFRQQIFDTPVYYESQSTLGYYRRLFADTNTAPLPIGDFSGRRADTYHQLTVPETLFGWLNVTPRVGERFTYYSSTFGPGATTTEQYREVFNTGAEVSFKASRVWSGVQNHFWDVDGLRHILEPSINYVYVPSPNVPPSQLPQFDYEPGNSLELLPIEFPDYNSIDSIDSQNVIRLGLNNRLQTKRNGQVEDLLAWQVYTDWRLRPRSGQTTFSDIYSELTLKPRTWLTFGSKTRYDIDKGRFNLAQHRITFEPNDRWSWTVGHLFLRSGPLFGIGDNLITSTFFYRLNENWGTRISHYFDAKTGTLQEQDYTLYRDLRSWTAAVTFRERDNLVYGRDYTVALTISLKAAPRYGLGSDTVNAASLVGY